MSASYLWLLIAVIVLIKLLSLGHRWNVIATWYLVDRTFFLWRAVLNYDQWCSTLWDRVFLLYQGIFALLVKKACLYNAIHCDGLLLGETARLVRRVHRLLRLLRLHRESSRLRHAFCVLDRVHRQVCCDVRGFAHGSDLLGKAAIIGSVGIRHTECTGSYKNESK